MNPAPIVDAQLAHDIVALLTRLLNTCVSDSWNNECRYCLTAWADAGSELHTRDCPTRQMHSLLARIEQPTDRHVELFCKGKTAAYRQRLRYLLSVLPVPYLLATESDIAGIFSGSTGYRYQQASSIHSFYRYLTSQRIEHGFRSTMPVYELAMYNLQAASKT